jgi:hypothetical protein
VLASTFSVWDDPQNGGGAPFRFCNDRPTFTSEPWNMGCLSQTIRQNQLSPCRPPFRARTSQSTADRYRPTHTITVVNESIMLHRYEHGLILCCHSDPIWTRLRRTGRALFSCRIPGLLLRVAVRHMLQGFRAAELVDTPRFEVSHMHGASQGCTCGFIAK